jgi:hypothetical protein
MSYTLDFSRERSKATQQTGLSRRGGGRRRIELRTLRTPTDGPVGDLLRAQRREPYRHAHLHVMGYKPGYKTLITQVFVPDDPYIENDVVLGRDSRADGRLPTPRRGRAAGARRDAPLVYP